jgi:hypothetical protein
MQQMGVLQPQQAKYMMELQTGTIAPELATMGRMRSENRSLVVVEVEAGTRLAVRPVVVRVEQLMQLVEAAGQQEVQQVAEMVKTRGHLRVVVVVGRLFQAVVMVAPAAVAVVVAVAVGG